MATYEETLTNISLDADATLAVDTSQPYTGNTAPAGGSASAGFQYRFVELTGEHTCGLFNDDTGSIPIGVLQNKPQVEGMAATVAVFGISMVEAGAAVAAGDVVGPDATGRAVTGGTPAAGIAIRGAGEAGDLIPVLLRTDLTASV